MLEKLNELTESHGELRPGKGMMSGVIALSLAILCFLGVLAFHFPEYLTTPELRKSYNVDVIRIVMYCLAGDRRRHLAVQHHLQPHALAGGAAFRAGGA
jgi:hypothetical protein